MLKKYLIILLLILALPYGKPTISAQSPTFTTVPCDLKTMQAIVDVFTVELGKLKTATDVSTIATKLQELANIADRMRATCDGLSFADKKQKLIGPVDFPVGTYRATAKTAGYMIVTITPAQGECGHGQTMDSNLFLIVDGAAADGAETLFVSQGCTAMVEVSNVQGDWSLKFDNLSTAK